MTIEKLTDENRAALLRTDEGAQALRIIDARAAEIEHLTVFAGTQTDECARLRAEVERLRLEEGNAGKLALWHAENRWAAEARLANAVGLLAQAPHAPGLRGQEWSRRRDAFLANQPAAPAECRDPAEIDRASEWDMPAAPARRVDCDQSPCLGSPGPGCCPPGAPTRNESERSVSEYDRGYAAGVAWASGKVL